MAAFPTWQISRVELEAYNPWCCRRAYICMSPDFHRNGFWGQWWHTSVMAHLFSTGGYPCIHDSITKWLFNAMFQSISPKFLATSLMNCLCHSCAVRSEHGICIAAPGRVCVRFQNTRSTILSLSSPLFILLVFSIADFTADASFSVDRKSVV